MEFTAEQISNWRKYEKVRQEGRYSMYDSRARIAAGLSRDEYKFVARHFSELKAAANNKEPS